MKKLLLSLSLSLTGYLGFSQINFGIKSGINIATTKDIITFPKNRIGWYMGGLAKIPISKKFFLEPELIYSSKGYRYIDLSDGETVAMRLNYLTVPILLGYEIDHKTKVVLGTELGYLLKATNYFNKENFDATSNFPQKFDIGINIGLAYNITKSLGSEIRYSYGFKNLYQTDIMGNRRSEFKGANRVFQIGVYYLLNK